MNISCYLEFERVIEITQRVCSGQMPTGIAASLFPLSQIALLWKHPQIYPLPPCGPTQLVRMDWSRGGLWTGASLVMSFVCLKFGMERHKAVRLNTQKVEFWWEGCLPPFSEALITAMAHLRS